MPYLPENHDTMKGEQFFIAKKTYSSNNQFIMHGES